MTEPAFRSASSLVRALRSGSLGSLELLDHYLARIARHNPTLNAIIAMDVEAARRQARAADAARRRGKPLGPLHGLPMTVKESFDLRGFATTWGLPALKRNIAGDDATAVRRLADAGAVIFGKTNTPVMLADWQTYNPVYGMTCNPWSRDHSPGGSSGGAAAALAAGLTSLELGSDIGGSIRNPAHACGVYGHRPSYGIVPTAGHALPGSDAPLDLNVAGPLARSAADLDLALGVLAGPEAATAGGWQLHLPPERRTRLAEFRVAVVGTLPVAPVDGAIRTSIDALARFLVREKAKVSRTARPKLQPEEVNTLYIHLLRASTSALQSQDSKAFAATLAAADQLRAADHSYYAEQLRGNTLRHRDWVIANNRRHVLHGAWLEFFKDYDLLLCPAAPTTAFPHDHAGERWQREVLVDGKRRSVNEHLFWAGYSGLFGLPSTVAPLGRSPAGLPIGLQIIGPPGGDRTCIRFARLLEREYHAFEIPPAFA